MRTIRLHVQHRTAANGSGTLPTGARELNHS